MRYQLYSNGVEGHVIYLLISMEYMDILNIFNVLWNKMK